MKIPLLPLALFALGLLPATAEDPVGFDTTPYQYQRGIVGAPVGDKLLRVTFDRDLYRHSGSDHSALRLVKEVGGVYTELPRVIAPVHRPPAPAGETRIPHRIESFEENDDGSIEISITLTGTTTPARLEIVTPLRDFEKNVTVLTSPDGITWTALVSNGLVFDYERFLDFRRTSLELPPTKARRFKVRLADATDQQLALVRTLSRTVSGAAGVTVSESGTVATRQFRINEIRFFTAAVEAVEKEYEETYELEILKQTVDAENKTTVLLLDGGGLPLREFTLGTEDRNFRRELLIQVPDKTTPDSWHTVQRGFLHSYHVGDFRDERLALRFEEGRSERYRLVIENGDNPPLRFTGVSGEGDLDELLFLAAPGERLSLFVGAPLNEVNPARLDTAAILAAQKSGVERTRLELSPLTENPTFRNEKPAEPRLFESKTLLWSIIALVVAMMIWILYLTLKRIDQIEGESEEE